jgi:hypothetical protein
MLSHIGISPESWAAVMNVRRVISRSRVNCLGFLQTVALHRQRTFAANFPHVETANANNEMLHFM